MKILISDNLSPRGLEVLRKHDGIEVDFKAGIPGEEVRRIIGDYDALIVRSETRVTAEIIASGSRLRVVGPAGKLLDKMLAAIGFTPS